MIKKFIVLSLLLICTGCAGAGTAFLGPSVTVAKTGNLYQAGMSYGSGHILKKTKESLKKIKNAKVAAYQEVDQLYKKINKEKLNKIALKDQRNLFFNAVKNNLKKYN
tara:strand:+ start:3199 stop:3522 length:324 start_codon:yes stop_codon:yes gene_type:complete